MLWDPAAPIDDNADAAILEATDNMAKLMARLQCTELEEREGVARLEHVEFQLSQVDRPWRDDQSDRGINPICECCLVLQRVCSSALVKLY